MKDLDKIKEAQAREDRRAESIARGEAQLMIGRGPADRALLLAAVPDMIREIDERGAALGEAARLLKEADAEIGTLRAEIERLRAPQIARSSDAQLVIRAAQICPSRWHAYECVLPVGHEGRHADEGRFTLWHDAADTRTTIEVKP